MTAGALLVSLLLAAAVAAFNIDTTEPIVRAAPNDIADSDAYFGYSVLLHRTSSSPTSFNDFVDNTWIIVGAPNGTRQGSAVERTGLIYRCPVNRGTCEGLMGDGNGVDNRLFDIAPNPTDGTNGATNENKTNQFLGVSMDSKNNHFVVCAHRHLDQDISGTRRLPRGKCFYTDNILLQNFRELNFCEGLGTGTRQFGYCQIGTSAALVEESNGDVNVVVGAPGTYGWAGVLFRYEPNTGNVDRLGEREGSPSNGWQGYATTQGRITQNNREDIITSVPRSRTYLGKVNIVSNNRNLDIIDFSLHGTQFGEYYGFSLASADLTGDGFDELLVGAPMYSTANVAETGRVYVYRNTGGSLSFVKELRGEIEEFTRFGHAIANLGDINGDGLADIAISAPFGVGSGKVYIYFGSSTDIMSNEPVQVIDGAELVRNLTNVTQPSGFGSSLASLVDIDGNKVNDLVIGAYASQQVFLLRSRAVAEVSLTLQAEPSVVQTHNNPNTTCLLASVTYPCFNVTVCATYPNLDTLPNNLSLTVKFTVDQRNLDLGLEQRVFFDNAGRTNIYETMVTFDKNQQQCITETVYVMNNLNDLFNGFPVEASIIGPSFIRSTDNGNPSLTSIENFPVISAIGTTQISVQQFIDCAGQTCIPDLQLSFLNITYETSTGAIVNTFTAGLVTNFNVWMRLRNALDNAYLAQLSFVLDTARFEFVRIEPRSLLISCSPEIQGSTTRINCPIANPMLMNEMREIAVRLRPTAAVIGSERSIQLQFDATSINPESQSTLNDNTFTTTLNIQAQADIFLDQAVTDPVQVSYNTINNATTMINVTNANDLGPQLTSVFVVRNAGPTTVPVTRLSIFWPLNPTDSTEQYRLIYPFTIMTSSTSAVQCANTHINIENLAAPIVDGGDEEATNTGENRRKRGLSTIHRRSKKSLMARQMSTGDSNTEIEIVDEIRDITIDCRVPGVCVEIICMINQLPSNGSAEINVVSYLDERYFSTRTDRYTFIAHGVVSILNSTFIVQPANHRSDNTSTQFRAVASTPPPRRGDIQVEWWMIVVPILLALIFFTIIGVILYFVGFFKRKHKQKKEEIMAQNLAESQGGEVET